MLKSLKRVNFKSEEANLLQENVYQFLNQINPITNSGILLFNVSVGASATKIDHRLGRKPQGFYIIDKTSDSNVWRSAPFDDLYLTLTSSSPTTISLWIF